jgi:chromosome segregation ATPase
MLAFLVCSAPRLANAQESQQADTAFSESRLEVVYEGPERSLNFLNAVANRIRPELPAGKKSSRPVQLQFEITPEESELDDDIKLRTLVVYWPTELKLSKEEQQALVENARKKMEAELRRIQNLADKARAARKQGELSDIQKTREQILAEWNDVVNKLSSMQRQYGLISANDVVKQMSQADSRLRELQIQEAGIAARREAVEERIDQVRKEIEAASHQEGGIIKELERLVEIRDDQLKKMKALNAAGRVVTGGEVQEAEAAVAKARIDLLSAKRDATESANGPALRELNNELSRLVIQAAENSGQQKRVKEQIDNLPGAQYQLELTDLQRNGALLQRRLTEFTDIIQAKEASDVKPPQPRLRPLVALETEQKEEKK